jgi:hypothetical protein
MAAEKILKILMLEDLQDDVGLIERTLRKEGMIFSSKRVDSQDPGERLLAQRHEIMTGNPHNAAGGFLKPGHHHQEGRFAGSAGAYHADRLARADGEIDTAQDRHGAGAALER